MNDRLLAEARAALARGWLPTPLNGKVPVLRNWGKLKPPSDGDLCRWVYDGHNLGIRTGNGLIVVDLDPGASADVVEVCERTPTPCVRTGRGKHYYFKGDARCSVGKISDHVDVRGEGGQVVMPCSLHPDTGEPYTWIVTPDECPLAEYPTALDALALAARKIRKAPEGKRNNTLNSATYAAASAGAPTRELADAALDVGLGKEEIERTIISATQAAPVYTHDTFEEILCPGEHFMQGGGTVVIDQTAFVRDVWRHIPPDTFYVRMGIPVRMIGGVLQPESADTFRAHASQFLRIYAHTKEGRAFNKEYRNFSADMAGLVMANAWEYCREIDAVVHYPIAEPVDSKWLVVGEHPTEPVTNFKEFWTELLCDFPFKSESDLRNYVAGLLTTVMRHKISGPCPQWMISASAERTGKTKLVTEVWAGLYGRDISPLAFSDDETELDKRLMARSLGGATILFFDNIRGKIDSAVLCSYATARSYSSRVLGQSKNVEFAVKALTVMTANNPAMSGEIAKRTITVRLESKVDHPEARTDFKYPDLEAHIRKNRPRILGALLAMAKLTGPAFIMGGFEAWGRIVGGAMAAAGMPLSQEEFTTRAEEADDETADVRVLIDAWSQIPGPNTVESLVSLVKEKGIFPRVQDAATPIGAQLRMSNLLRGLNGRTLGGYRVTGQGVGTRRLWRLVPVSDAPPP